MGRSVRPPRPAGRRRGRHPARRRRRRDRLARTRDGRASRPQRTGRRSTGGRSLAGRSRWGLLLHRRRGLVADDSLGGGDAAARGDRHFGLRRRLLRHGISGRGLRDLRILDDGRRGPGRFARHLLGPGQSGWAGGPLGGNGSHHGLGGPRGLRLRRGLGGLRGDRLLRGRRLRHLDLDHRRGWRLEQTVALGPAPDPVGLGFHNARGVGLDPDAEREAEFERLLVGQPEFLGELMDADLSWQRVPPSGLHAVCGPGSVPGARRPRTSKPIYLVRPNVSPESPPEGPAAPSRVEAGDVGAEPGAPARAGPEPQRSARGHANPEHLRAGATGSAADTGADGAHRARQEPNGANGTHRARQEPNGANGAHRAWREPNGANGAQARPACSAGDSAPLASEASAWSWAMAAVQASALTASPPSAGCHSCSPVAGSVIHSPSAHSTSP